MLPGDAPGQKGDSLQRAYREAEQALNVELFVSDIATYEMILRAPENRFFERLAELASYHSVRIRSLLQATVPSQKVLVIADEHSVLLQPLRARGAALASERLVSHQEHGMERTLSALKQIRVSEA